METEPTPPVASRPRPILLVLLGIAVVALAITQLMPSGSATQAPRTSNQPRTAAVPTSGEGVDPQDLDVHLGLLAAKRPAPSEASRNPFRFRPAEAPPAPTAPSSDNERAPERFTPPPPQPPVETGPPPPPPIPLKYLGLIEGQGKKLAALSDCKFTYRGEEGEIVDGRYRLVKIGVESVVMEHVDGRGRTTIRLSGQDCVGR